jgi:hypothetical protein
MQTCTTTSSQQPMAGENMLYEILHHELFALCHCNLITMGVQAIYRLPASARYQPDDQCHHEYYYKNTNTHTGFKNATHYFAGAEREHQYQ